MSDHIHKMVEIAGSSSKSYEDAVRSCIRRTSKTVRDIKWFQIMEQRGTLAPDGSLLWQVVIKIGFEVESGTEGA